MKHILKSREADLAASAVGIAIVLLVGIISALVFFQTSAQIPQAQGVTETFDVVNASTNEEYTLTYTPTTITKVEIHNKTSGNWTTIASSKYSVSGNVVTVDKTAYTNTTNDDKTRITYDTATTDTVASYTNYAKLSFGFIGLAAFIGAAFLIIGIMRGRD